MANVQSIEAGKYNKLLAAALQKEEAFVAPEWVFYVKTSTHKSRPSIDVNFWHNRTASVLRQVYLKGTVGVQRLRTRYGGKKKRGSKPSEFRKGGGKIIRTILKQAEQAGLVQKAPEGSKAGRQLTDKGKQFLESVAGGKQ